jgi:hypothetical protein
VSWVRVGKILGAVAAAVILFVTIISDSPLRAPIIALSSVIVLVAAGNLLNDWLGIRRSAPVFQQVDHPEEPEGDAK